jgi:hypothetical protein
LKHGGKEETEENFYRGFSRMNADLRQEQHRLIHIHFIRR